MTTQDTPPRARRRTGLMAMAMLITGCASAHAMPTTPPRSDRMATRVRDSVRAVLARALADSAFPGAIAAVGRAEGVITIEGVGHLDWAPSPAPDENTIWDLASLTKVIGTTTALMQLWEQRRVDLDAPVQRYLPEWRGAHKELVTVRHLLTHSAGLPAFELFYKQNAPPGRTLAMVLQTPLDTLPGVRMVYSDIGAILMGLIVERVSGESLDRYLAQHVFAPLGMTSTMFRPPDSLRDRIAPTEVDPWRGVHVRGVVHDENAYALGGVAGHAGLFSSARDLARFARMMLSGGELDGARIVSRAAIDTFTTVQRATLSNRALGWETPTGHNSAGHLLSPRAFGHTGFTGTSIWIDPARDVFVLLLSNRVDPTRANTRIGAVRPALADAVLEAMGAIAAALPDSTSGQGSPP